MRACVPAWFTCQRACVPAWFTCQLAYVSTCQKCAKFSILRANVPNNVQGVAMFQLGMPTCQTACRFFNLACQSAKECQFFKHSSYEMLREISILYYYIKFYIVLDITLIHIMCVCIVHINCITLYFLKLFWALDKDGNVKAPGFYTLQLTREYCNLLELRSAWVGDPR